MPKHNSQHTDAENSRAPYTATRPGDDLKVSSRGSLQSIAGEDYRGQQHLTGEGGDCVEANVEGGQP